MRILLAGPTAVGKTSLSLALAESLDAEIISGDSRQCYRYLNIGTASPGKEELERVRHYNISILDPARKDSAANFYDRAMEWEEQIRDRDKQVLYVGGSTLHMQSIIQPLDELPSADEANIAQLEQRIDEEGIENLYHELERVDPEYAEQMDGHNTQRIVRALDVWMQTGRPFSSFHSDDNTITLPPETIVFGLKRERQELYDRINRRVDRMFEQGLLDEVRQLLDMGYTRKSPGLNTVGYRDAIDYLEGRKSEEEMIRDIKTQTRRYAKRQLTWFRRWDFIQWIPIDQVTEQEAIDFISKNLAAKLNKD